MEDYIITDGRKQNALIAIVSVSVFMFSLDYSILNISLPLIASYFMVTVGVVSRLPLAYLLVVTSTVLIFGKLGDTRGFKLIFITGLVIFVIGTLLCSLARDMNTLLAFRILQCFGEAMFSPMGIALVTTLLPSNVKGKGLGIMATAQGLGFCLGPIIGGYINSHLSWHWIFLVNVLPGLILIIAARKLIWAKQPKTPVTKLDYFGAFLIFVCLATLIFVLNSLLKRGLKDPLILASFAVSAVSLVLFIIQEKRCGYPILELSLFKNKDFTFSTTSALCIVFVYMALLFLFPFYLELVRRTDIMNAGFMLMLPALMMTVSAPIGGKLCDAIGSRKVCILGSALTTFAFILFALLKPQTPSIYVIPSLAIAGIAIGFFLPSNNKLVMMQAPADKQGMASAVYKIIMSIGGVFGIAILPLILMNKIRVLAAKAGIEMAQVKDHPVILMAGFSAAFKAGILICLAGLILSIFARDRKEV